VCVLELLDVVRLTNVLTYLLTYGNRDERGVCWSVGHATAVGSARGDRAAVQLLQVRQRVADHVPGVVHSSATEQGRTLLQLDADTPTHGAVTCQWSGHPRNFRTTLHCCLCINK